MAEHLVVYTVVHQPRRPKLPAQPIPQGARIRDIEHCLFDERLNERKYIVPGLGDFGDRYFGT